MDWQKIGFNEFFQRRDKGEGMQNDPNYLGYQMDSYQQDIPASVIQDGIMKSKNGNLILDLNQGLLQYNDGVTNLFSLGGEDNNMTLLDADGGTLVES